LFLTVPAVSSLVFDFHLEDKLFIQWSSQKEKW